MATIRTIRHRRFAATALVAAVAVGLAGCDRSSHGDDGTGTGSGSSARTSAAPGIDTSFGDAGRARAGLPEVGAGIAELTPCPDGTTIALGGDDALRRISPSGALDTSFAGDGALELPEMHDAHERLVRCDDRERIYVAYTPKSETLVRIRRFDRDGEPDPGFRTFTAQMAPRTPMAGWRPLGGLCAGTGGRSVLATSEGIITLGQDGSRRSTQTGPGAVQALALDSKGRLLALTVADSRAQLTRYDSTWARPDPGFGDGGTVVLDVLPDTYPPLLVDGADRPLVAEAVGAGQVLRRYRSDGRPDDTFADAGQLTLGNGDAPVEVVVQGTSLVTMAQRSPDEVELTRRTDGGDLDPAFGSGGTLQLATSQPGPALGGAPARDGVPPVLTSSDEQLLVGSASPSDDPLWGPVWTDVVTALDPSGHPRGGFGTHGVARFRPAELPARIVELHARSQGGVLAELSVPGDEPAGTTSTILAAFTPEGRRDASFSSDSILADPAVEDADVDGHDRVLVLRDGRVATTSQGSRLSRLDPSGEADPTFAGGGIDLTGNRVAATADGAALVWDDTNRGPARFVAADGTLDQAFPARFDAARRSLAVITAVPNHRGGLDVLLGPGPASTATSGAVVRLGAAGELDTSFAEGGTLTLPHRATQLAALPDGSVVTGDVDTGQSADTPVALRRYLANGTPVAATGGYDAEGVLEVASLRHLVASAPQLVTLGGDGMARVYRADGTPSEDWPGPGSGGHADLGEPLRQPGVVAGGRLYVAIGSSVVRTLGSL